LVEAELAMTTTINLAEAKAKLSALVDRAAAGEEIVVAKAGRPVARITALPDQGPRRPDIAAHWDVDDEALLAPADQEELDWANGKYSDELGRSLPRKR
jgi:prevent-host-death family protein